MTNSSMVHYICNKGRRKRVLMVAYACSPYRGSEPGVGWHRAIEASKYFDVWVICEQYEFQHDIEQYAQEHGENKNLHFIFVPRVPRSHQLYKILIKRIPTLFYLIYDLWHRKMAQRAQSLCAVLHSGRQDHVRGDE